MTSFLYRSHHNYVVFTRVVRGISVVPDRNQSRQHHRYRGEVSRSSAVLLPHAPSSVTVARQRLYQDLLSRGVFESAIDDAALVLSELMSNALRHARPLPSGRVRVVWRVRGETIEVQVSDGGAPGVPLPRQAGPSSLGGRGLDIVDRLTEHWGVHHERRGTTTVWAHVAAPHPAVVG